MDELQQLLALADRYKAHTGLSEATVSSRVLGGGSRIQDIRGGGDVGVRRVRRAILWFSEHWPEGAEWPAGVERPAAKSDGEAA
jgi:hypothetical protein